MSDLRERLRPFAETRWLEVGWFAFAVVNLTWMSLDSDWASVPFHFIWVSLTLLYGFRAWTRTFTWVTLALTVVLTGIIIGKEQMVGLRPNDESLEVPLMAAMFLAMMLHADRRKKAIQQLNLVSEANLHLLERERVFVANASHELRTPITVALVHAELVQRSSTDPATAQDATIIADELERLRRLVDRLLLLASVEEPQLLRPVRTDLPVLLDECMRRWAPVPRGWSMTAREDAVVMADPDRLMLAVDAMVENAVKFTSDGDVVDLSVVRDPDGAALVVSDGGPGIPEERLEEVFDRFSRGEDNPMPRGSFGLGLAIVRAVAEAHGGTVETGVSTFGGAAVTLRLPLALPDAPIEPALPSPAGDRTQPVAVGPRAPAG